MNGRPTNQSTKPPNIKTTNVYKKTYTQQIYAKI